MDSIIKIAIVGPESTGKSTLAVDLAEHYKTVYVPEFARIYLEEMGLDYTIEDVEHIAREQLKLEQQQLRQANKILICDTSLLVIKVWMEYVFGSCPPWIIDEINETHYDLYLLNATDIKWQPDTLRVNLNEREELFNIYLNELQTIDTPFKIIVGIGNQRLINATKIVDHFVSTKPFA